MKILLASVHFHSSFGWSISQALQRAGHDILEFEYRHRPAFTVTDGERALQVRYTGNAVLPDTFRDKALVVLEGRLTQANQFEADLVFAKCPSKYEGESYDDHVEALKKEGQS